MDMFARKVISVLLICTLLTYILQGQVLCYGDDGHIDIEPAFHCHCDHQDHNHADHTEHETHLDPSVNDCGSCKDVHIENDSNYVRINGTFIKLDNLPQTSIYTVSNSFDIDFNSLNCYTFFSPLKIIVLIT